MNFATFSDANRGRCESPKGFNHKLSSWTRAQWLQAVLGELGEAANIAKKLDRIRDGIPGNAEGETEEFLADAFRREIADVFCYLDLLAQSQGFTLEYAVREKFNETSIKNGFPHRIA